MSDNYNIDDILAEVEKMRKEPGEEEPSAFTQSVTEIIGGAAYDEALQIVKSTLHQSEEEAAENAQSERAEELRAAAEKRKSEKNDIESKKTEKANLAERLEEARKRKTEEARLLEEKKLLEEKEARERQIEEEKRKKAEYEKSRVHTGFTAEMSSPEEASKLFYSDTQKLVLSKSEHVKPFIKPDVSGADEDIIFHTRGDFVTTETMQMKKQIRIDEINRALLEADRSAETPDELVDSLNPMDSRAKAVEDLRSSMPAQGDTLALGGNDLKKLSAGEERVKQYSPVKKKGKPKTELDNILTTSAPKENNGLSEKERRGNDALVASLNKRLKEQRERNIEEEKTVTLSNISDSKIPANALNIDYEKQLIDTSLLPKTDPIAAEMEANDLAARKKRRIANFMLADIEDEVEAVSDDDDEDDDEDEEPIDLDDENVVTEKLNKAFKGLVSRLAILGVFFIVAVLAGLIYQFNLNWGFVSTIVNKSNYEGYLVTYLVIGILSLSACSSVITNGFSRLIRLKPDGDTICSFSHIGAMLSIILYLAKPEYVQMGQAHIYITVSLAALCFNTLSKICTVRAAQNNYRFVSGDSAKYFIECSSGEGEKLAKGKTDGIPVTASMHKTELLCDFIISTYCEDISDIISRIAAPVSLLLALIGGAMAYMLGESADMMNNLAWAATVASALLAIGATFSGALIVMLPMLNASKTVTGKNAAVLGYSAVEDFSAVNAVLLNAKLLFPANSVNIRNIWDYNKNGKHGTQHIMIDEAIIYAASLAISADSVLSDAFFNMLNYKSALLKKVSNCVYESNLGVMGWIGSRRVLLGNREHMKSHGVAVPDSRKEAAANRNNNEVVYLAVGGEVCMLFFVELSANAQVKQHLQKLVRNDVSVIIKSVDGMISEGAITELFDISNERVRVIPSEAHEEFDERTKYTSKGSAAASCDGTFSSFASVINAAKALREKIMLGCTMQISGMALGALLIFVFAGFTNYGMFNCFYILIYNLVWLILTLAVQAFKRIT